MNAANNEFLSGNDSFSYVNRVSQDVTARCNAELYRIFHKQIYAAIVVSALNAVLVAAVVWSSVPQVPLVAWGAFLIGLSVLRILIFTLRRRGKMLTNEDAITLRRAATAVITVGGAAWGVGAVFVILSSDSDANGEDEHEPFLRIRWFIRCSLHLSLPGWAPARWRDSHFACPPFTAFACRPYL